MGSDLVGRDEELAAITHLLLRVAAGGSGCCLIEGAVGIGKTALWNAALELAGQRGFLVLKAHPVEAETAYSFAAVADLLRPVLDEVLKGLPAPQKVALETALLIDGGNDRAPDPHAVSMAALTALECVDAVAVFDADDPRRALRALRPDLWVKGGDHDPAELPETPLVRSWGGDVVVIPLTPGQSTTSIINRLRDS